MLKTTAFIGLGLCVLLLSGCAPKIDGSSAKAYEDSLVKVASGLDSHDKFILDLAIQHIQELDMDLSQLDHESNQRLKISGMNRIQIIEKAKSEILHWFDENKENEKIYYKYKDALLKDVEVDVVKVKVNYVLEPFSMKTLTLRISNKSTVPITVKGIHLSGRDVFVEDIVVGPGEKNDFTTKALENGIQLGPATVTMAVIENVEVSTDPRSRFGNQYMGFLELIGCRRNPYKY